MLAEAFDEEVQAFCQSAEHEPELLFKLGLIGLYEKCLNTKYDICAGDKCKIPLTDVGAGDVRENWVKTTSEIHQILALKVLFGEEQLKRLRIISECTSSDEVLARPGIV
jgi:hypothetical protein